MSIKKLARKLWTGRSSREVQQSLFRRRPLFEALERRYLMSAELVPPPPPPAGEQAPVTMPAQPGQAGPQARRPARRARIPGRARRLPEAGRAGRTDFAGSVRQGQRRAPGRRQGLAAGPGGRPARAPDRHRGLHHAVRARRCARSSSWIRPSTTPSRWSRGCTAWSAARPKDWADWPGRRARARSCRCCAAMTPRSSCWTAAMTASTRSPESWGSTRTWRPCRS